MKTFSKLSLKKQNDILMSSLTTILNCGLRDVIFLLNECDTFEVDFWHVWSNACDTKTQPELNDLLMVIHEIAFYQAIRYAKDNTDIDPEVIDGLYERDSFNIEQYYNFIDSSFYFEGTEITDYQQLCRELIDYLNYSPDLDLTI